MRIAVVNAALSALDDELNDPSARSSAPVERLHLDMNEKSKSKTQAHESQANESPADADNAKSNPAFDSWLETKLHKMFDAVAAEPLPPDLVKLLEQLDKKTQGEPEKKN